MSSVQLVTQLENRNISVVHEMTDIIVKNENYKSRLKMERNCAVFGNLL